MKVLVTEAISDEGVDILSRCAQLDVKLGLSAESIASIIGDYEALVVCSQTKVSPEIIEAGSKLQVIARAGVGIDNVNVEAATRCCIVVVNAPTGNTISAAEHTIVLMLSLACHIPQANAALKSGLWQRSKFMGSEVRNKVPGYRRPWQRGLRGDQAG
jgi:D-3-phosphoglycerate dehydrogenase